MVTRCRVVIGVRTAQLPSSPVVEEEFDRSILVRVVVVATAMGDNSGGREEE